MSTATSDHTTTPTEAPFEAVRRRLLGPGGITHVGNIGYTFGGGSMGLLARRYGMAAGRPSTAAHRQRCAGPTAHRAHSSPAVQKVNG